MACRQAMQKLPACHRAYSYLQENAEKFGLDPARVAIIGGSAGGLGAFYTIANYNDRYQAFINCWGAPEVLPCVENFPPVLSIHGTEDALVPYSLETAAQDALEAAHIRHELITLEGCGHTPLNKMDEFLPRMLHWLESNL